MMSTAPNKSLSAKVFKHSKLSLVLMTLIVGMASLPSCTKPADNEPVANQSETSETATAEPKKAEADSAPKEVVSETVSDEEKLAISYANMAQATFQDSLSEAKKLQTAIDVFIDKPSDANLTAAKAAYKAARQPYSQTEVFRFDEGFVTKDDSRAISSVDGWEGQVNAWPLDEALIDYVSEGYAGEYNSKDNIINSNSISVGGDTKDTTTITPDLLADMNELGGSEANVTTGYHAIEFLLWGQDTNGVGEGAGNRPVSDYMADENCTSGAGNPSDAAICAKRGDYLKAATQLLVNDLSDMVAQWQPDSEGTLRSDLMARANDTAVRQMFYQMGSLALGELASERMQVAFVTGSTEDEHECFSDLTHLSYANNARGIQNVFEGEYETVSGQTAGDYGIKDYLEDKGQKDAAEALEAQFDKVEDSFDMIADQGEGVGVGQGVKIDQMIATVGQASKFGISAEEQNKRRGWMESAINDLKSLTDSLEMAAKSIGIENLDADTGSQF